MVIWARFHSISAAFEAVESPCRTAGALLHEHRQVEAFQGGAIALLHELTKLSPSPQGIQHRGRFMPGAFDLGYARESALPLLEDRSIPGRGGEHPHLIEDLREGLHAPHSLLSAVFAEAGGWLPTCAQEEATPEPQKLASGVARHALPRQTQRAAVDLQQIGELRPTSEPGSGRLPAGHPRDG